MVSCQKRLAPVLIPLIVIWSRYVFVFRSSVFVFATTAVCNIVTFLSSFIKLLQDIKVKKDGDVLSRESHNK